jgi:predicted nucleic acid-binding protein
VIPIDASVALAAGRLRARREQRGRPVAQADMLIAACALTHGLTLVTRNLDDFEGCGIALLDPFD